MNLRERFKQNEWSMIQYILTNGRKESWGELGLKYGIRSGSTGRQIEKATNDIWRKYQRLSASQTIQREAIKEEPTQIDQTESKQVADITSSMTIKKITKGPHGDWVTYESKEKEENTILNTVVKLLEKHLPEKDRRIDYKEYCKHRIQVDENCEIFFGQDNNCHVVEGEDDKIAIVNLYDAHLDKLPIKSTCGVESTLESNISTFRDTVLKIRTELAKQEGLKMIILPLGNDLFHTNGFNSQTKKGTNVEYYCSPEEAYYAISDAVTEAIKDLAFLRPVKVIMVKGNHDEDKITTLGYWLNRYFSNMDTNMYHKVEVDFLRNQRKYIQFGENLLGFAHGDKEKQKIAQLPLIMATEAKKMWGDTTYRKMYLGDLHHGFEYQFLKAKDQPGVEVEYLRSVGTTDSWHEDFGWVGVPKTAYMQIFHRTEGEIIRQKFNIK